MMFGGGTVWGDVTGGNGWRWFTRFGNVAGRSFGCVSDA